MLGMVSTCLTFIRSSLIRKGHSSVVFDIVYARFRKADYDANEKGMCRPALPFCKKQVVLLRPLIRQRIMRRPRSRKRVWGVDYILPFGMLSNCVLSPFVGKRDANALGYRPAGPSETESGRQTQERVVREVWKRVRELDYNRPGA